MLSQLLAYGYRFNLLQQQLTSVYALLTLVWVMLVEHHSSVHTIACSGLQPILRGLSCFTVQSMSTMDNIVCCAVAVKSVSPLQALDRQN